MYLSYINEYEFKQNSNRKSLKEARYWANKAISINSENVYVQQQNKDVKETVVNLKRNKKKD